MRQQGSINQVYLVFRSASEKPNTKVEASALPKAKTRLSHLKSKGEYEIHESIMLAW
jgi:hypothetical protein